MRSVADLDCMCVDCDALISGRLRADDDVADDRRGSDRDRWGEDRSLSRVEGEGLAVVREGVEDIFSVLRHAVASTKTGGGGGG